MESKRRVLIRFSRREDFGGFCVALNKTDLPFTMNGFHGIVMLEKHYNAMTEELKKLASSAEVTRIVRGGQGKRPPSPPVSEVESTLWNLAKTHLR
jgi:hypothetical protein